MNDSRLLRHLHVTHRMSAITPHPSSLIAYPLNPSPVVIVISHRGQLGRQWFVARLQPDFTKQLGLGGAHMLMTNKFQNSQEHPDKLRLVNRTFKELRKRNAPISTQPLVDQPHVDMNRSLVVAN